ncbi:MAG: hypothetical protein GX877_03900 [Bacteroidales bacterium]|nr:hypothetical protein [Bacteroidales bacterium]
MLHHLAHYWHKHTSIYLSCLFIVASLLSPLSVAAQSEEEYLEEMVIYFSVPRIGGTDISAILGDTDVYLSITEIFDFLKIKNTFTPGFDSIYGFFITEDAPYEIDRVHHVIKYKGKEYKLKPSDFVRTETGLYLKTEYYGEVFGLDCSFNFRSLSVTMNTSVELPVVREMRQEQMRKSLSRFRGDIEADTTIGRKYPLLHFGMADWNVVMTQQVGGVSDARVALNLGGVLAGGETNVRLNYDTRSGFQKRNQFYEWRFVNNDFKIMRQATVGKIGTFATSTISSPVLGVQLTNTPTTYRQSFGTYTLSDVTEPGWTVELYVNNVLIDYQTADASGFYTFEVPMIYGNTNVKLQFYGPWGEERYKEQTINIPYNFLPTGTFEYRVSAGVVEDSLWSRFSRVDMDYGVARFMTIGAGVEYLSSVTSTPVMPFVHTSIRLAPSLLLTGQYIHGVNVKGVLNWRLPSDIQLEANYTKYHKDQTAINTNYQEERRLSLSIPIRAKRISFYTRMGVNQIVMPNSKYTTAELLFSGNFMGVSTNFTTFASFSRFSKANIFSNLSMSIRLPASFILTPQTQFSYTQKKFVSARMALEKRFRSNGYINLSYERNFLYGTSNLELGMRYDFSFAQIGFSARRSNKIYSFVETASGSLMADFPTKYAGLSNRSSVGRGGMVLCPFLDLNWNGVRDKGEPKVLGLEVRVSGGRTQYNERDTLTRVHDLQPYTEYLVTLDGSRLDNIAWKLAANTVSVKVDPNQFKRVEIPVVVMGEASGQVYIRDERSLRGQGRITLHFYSSDTLLRYTTMSESDGYFSYMGLPPGDYLAAVDPQQMKNLDMTASPGFVPFTVHPSLDGDFIYDLEFIIQSNVPTVEKPAVEKPIVEEAVIEEAVIEEAVKEAVVEKTIVEKAVVEEVIVKEAVVEKAVIVKPKEEKPEELMVIGGYRLQLLVLSKPIEDSERYFAPLTEKLPNLKIVTVQGENKLYHYVTQVFRTRSEALHWMRMINSMGWKDCVLKKEEASH